MRHSKLEVYGDGESFDDTLNLSAWLPGGGGAKTALPRRLRDAAPDVLRHLMRSDFFGLKADLEVVRQCRAPCQTVDRLAVPHATVPSEPRANYLSQSLMAERNRLPIFHHRGRILQVINENQVTLIIGETGSGKSTQIPQFIIDEKAANGENCRIIVTEPRRIAALTVAERCANERGENLGETIGYQIRLEKAISNKTVVTFCTNGILLRTLIGARQSLASITHLIIDEVHERDKMSDFLITVIRQVLPEFPKIRVVLMSASLNTSKFSDYFNNPAIIEVPGRVFNVEEFYLEDVLKLTKYRINRGFGRFGGEESESEPENGLDHKTNDVEEDVETELWEQPVDIAKFQSSHAPVEDCSPKEVRKLDQDEIDELLDDTWENGRLFGLVDLVKKIEAGEVDLDCSHSISCLTPLAIAAGMGVLDTTRKLLQMGAARRNKLSHDMAKYLARRARNKHMLRLLDGWEEPPGIKPNAAGCLSAAPSSNGASFHAPVADSPTSVLCGGSTSGAFGVGFGCRDFGATKPPIDGDGTNPLLEAYLDATADFGDQIDAQLVVELVCHIVTSSKTGAILIFLPGYEDIMMLKDRLQADIRLMRQSLSICMLHSQMQPKDQKEAFLPVRHGARKIILSTNIAEISVTINDVYYVVDCGKMKEKIHDGLSGISMLCNVWISKANAIQRKGRAGRCSKGVCYRLFSKLRFESMPENPVPEILRVPIHELCLQTKLLFPEYTSVCELLSKAPDPPSNIGIKNAVNLLKTIGAMTENENLTRLGRRIVELPVEPQFAKMLLFGVLFKCLEPVLTIVACMTYRDPFILPKLTEEKSVAMKCRCAMNPLGAFSDHLVFVKAYEGYLAAFDRGTDRQYCNQNYLSPVCMNMIYGVREQLKAQLARIGYLTGEYANFNKNAEKWPLVKAALVAGSYPYLAYVDKEQRKILTRCESVEVSKFSTLLGGQRFTKAKCALLPTDWLVYNELTRVKRCVQLKCATAVSSLTAALFSGSIYLSRSEAIKKLKTCSTFENWDEESTSATNSSSFGILELEVLNVGEFVFKCDQLLATKIMLLREKIFGMFIDMIKMPWNNAKEDPAAEDENEDSKAHVSSNFLDRAALNALAGLLEQEDKKLAIFE